MNSSPKRGDEYPNSSWYLQQQSKSYSSTSLKQQTRRQQQHYLHLLALILLVLDICSVCQAYSIQRAIPTSLVTNRSSNIQKPSFVSSLNLSSTESDDIVSAATATATATKEKTLLTDPKKESINMYPNWRTFSKHNDDEPTDTDNHHHLVSPFAHQQTNTKSSSYINKPWSRSAFQSSLDQYQSFINCPDSYIGPLIKDALESLEHAYRLYGPENVIASFNGGKDAVVILELMRAAHAKFLSDTHPEMTKEDNNNDKEEDDDESNGIGIQPRLIYFNHKLEFPQVYNFVQQTVQNYDLNMIAFEEGIGFVDGLDILVKRNYASLEESKLSSSLPPRPMAFTLGTRDSDPNAGKQGTFAPSSTWMPPFMRVNPVLTWSYGHVWHFLRLYKLPYCSLYDEGYTSLGNLEDTLPCPALKKVTVGSSGNADDGCDYWPAYMLKDWDLERAGRIKKEKKPKQQNNTTDKEMGSGTSSNSDTDATNEKNISTTSSSTVSSTNPPSSSSASSSSVNNGAKDSKNLKAESSSLPSTTNPSSPSDDDKHVSFKNKKEVVVENNEDNNNEVDNNSLASSTSTSSQRTVGILIIGDEILKGLTPDTNTHAAASALRANNVPLARVAVVSDDLEEIVNEIKQMDKNVDVIITSGGVGPTHDDVTIKSVAAALDSKMVLNYGMAKLLLKKMGNNDDENDNVALSFIEEDGDEDLSQYLTKAQIKMATLPACSKLRYFSKNPHDWPVLQCENIFILPGVPQFFEKKISDVAAYLSTELERSVAFKVVLSIDENSIVPVLDSVVENHPNVSFGSYPFVNHPEYKTVVTLEGRKLEGGHLRNSGRYLVDVAALLDEDSSSSDSDVESTSEVQEEMEDKRDSFKRFGKDQMNTNVKVALADLVNRLPEESILRVDNNDDLTLG